MSPCLRHRTREELAKTANAINNKDTQTAEQDAPCSHKVLKLGLVSQSRCNFSAKTIPRYSNWLILNVRQRQAQFSCCGALDPATDPKQNEPLVYTSKAPSQGVPGGQTSCSGGYQKRAGRAGYFCYLGSGAGGLS